MTEAQLEIAAGRVRCGACLSVFTGLEHLVLGPGPRLRAGENADAALDALLDELGADTPPPTAGIDVDAAMQQRGTMRPDRLPSPARRTSAELLGSAARALPDATTPGAAGRTPVQPDGGGSERAPIAELHTPSAPAMPAADARKAGDARRVNASNGLAGEPHFTPADPPNAVAVNSDLLRVPLAATLELGPEDIGERPRRRRRWWAPLVFALGAALLAGQVLYFQFDAWATNPRFRPAYEWVCPRVHCDLPIMRSLDDIYAKNLVVRVHPDIPGTLLVDALIVNEAPFPQPFPVIELRFSSLRGDLVAAPRFRPAEYLAGELAGVAAIAPLTPVHVALQVADPGDEAVNYVLVFR